MRACGPSPMSYLSGLAAPPSALRSSDRLFHSCLLNRLTLTKITTPQNVKSRPVHTSKSKKSNQTANPKGKMALPRVFFDMTADGQSVGRLVIEVSCPFSPEPDFALMTLISLLDHHGARLLPRCLLPLGGKSFPFIYTTLWHLSLHDTPISQFFPLKIRQHEREADSHHWCS